MADDAKCKLCGGRLRADELEVPITYYAGNEPHLGKVVIHKACAQSVLDAYRKVYGDDDA